MSITKIKRVFDKEGEIVKTFGLESELNLTDVEFALLERETKEVLLDFDLFNLIMCEDRDLSEFCLLIIYREKDEKYVLTGAIDCDMLDTDLVSCVLFSYSDGKVTGGTDIKLSEDVREYCKSLGTAEFME